MLGRDTDGEFLIYEHCCIKGPVRESNPGPLAPKARIMPLDQQAVQGKLPSRPVCCKLLERELKRNPTTCPNVVFYV